MCAAFSESVEPKVSVIIPVYNAERTLPICLNSILNQTLRNIEIICVDDGSKDKSLKILNEYASKDKRITIIHHENCGIACTINTGLTLVKGQYISIVDADDWIELDTYETVYKTAEDNDVDIVHFAHFRKREVRGPKENKILHGIDAAWSQIDFSSDPYYWSRLYKKSLIIDNKILYDTSEKIAADGLFNLDVIPYVKSIFELNKPLYHHIPTSSGIMRSNSTWEGGQMYLDNLLRHWEMIKNKTHIFTRRDDMWMKRKIAKFRKPKEVPQEERKKKKEGIEHREI